MGKSLPSLCRDQHPAIRGFQLQGTTQGIPSGPKKTPPGQTKTGSTSWRQAVGSDQFQIPCSKRLKSTLNGAYVQIYIYIYLYIYICIHTYIYMIYTDMYIYIYTYIHTHIHIHTHIDTHIHIYIYIYMYTYNMIIYVHIMLWYTTIMWLLIVCIYVISIAEELADLEDCQKCLRAAFARIGADTSGIRPISLLRLSLLRLLDS